MWGVCHALLHLISLTSHHASNFPTLAISARRQILKHLQVNKFKVQLAVVMDLPLTILNLYILWIEDSSLIQSPLFTASLILAVFSAGKISTLIEYHLELRQRKRKLERLLLVISNHPLPAINSYR